MVGRKPPPMNVTSVDTRMKSSTAWNAYVGCRTTRERQAQGRGLSVYRVVDGMAWESLQLLEGLRNPSFLCLHPGGHRLYAVHGDFGEISTFAVRPDGRLEQLAEQSTLGRNPVHLALTPSLQWLLVANYATGSVVSMRAGAGGALGSVAHLLELPGSCGPHPQQRGAHPHQICFTPDGRYAMVPDKGLDRVFAVRVNEETGHLSLAHASGMPAGCGPRHMVFHGTGPKAYVVGELDRTVLTVSYEASTGRLAPLAASSTVPEGETDGSAAGIALDAANHLLYVSNRGQDSVARYAVDPVSGALGAPSWIPTGKTPRFITLSPEGDALYIANEESHSLYALRHGDAVAHPLVQTGSPVCIVFQKAHP